MKRVISTGRERYMVGEYRKTQYGMTEAQRALKGSPNRDLFKQLHKQLLPRHMFAADADLFVIEKNPDGIVALYDFKMQYDGVTFSEVITYNAQRLAFISVFIIEAANETALKSYCFDIREYKWGNRTPNPPIVEWGHSWHVDSAEEFAEWEQNLRNKWKRWRVKQRQRAQTSAVQRAFTLWTGDR